MTGSSTVPWEFLVTLLVALLGGFGTILGLFIRYWLNKSSEGIKAALAAIEKEKDKGESAKDTGLQKWMNKIDNSIQDLTRSVANLEKQVFGDLTKADYIADQKIVAAEALAECKQVDLKLDKAGSRVATLELRVVKLEERSNIRDEIRDQRRDQRITDDRERG